MHVSGRQDFPLNLLLLVLHILFINLRGRKLTATNIFGKVNDGQKKSKSNREKIHSDKNVVVVVDVTL